MNQLWQQLSHPIVLDTHSIMDQKLVYIHQNHVEAGLVTHAEAWRHSTGANYAGETKNILICCM
ncbi:MAG TPA: hypothetical protein VF691_21110 [Cytophagaceae bacterium]|jgi:hypothetical protein